MSSNNPFASTPTPFQDLKSQFLTEHDSIKYKIERSDWGFYVIGNNEGYGWYIHKRCLSGGGDTAAAINSVVVLKEMGSRGVSTCLYHDMHDTYTEPLWVKDLANWIGALPDAYETYGKDMIERTIGKIRGCSQGGLGLERGNNEFRNDIELIEND